MAGFEQTHIRIPKNDTDFEIKSVVLFKGLLKDPNVKRLGRSGQRQDGVDVVGYRNGEISRLVGIQCKLKGPKEKLTEKEVRDEVRKALKYKPALSEYFIITSAPNDTALDQLAQALSRQQKAKGRKIRIEVWGWGVLEERINEDLDAKNAFDPGWSPAVGATQTALKDIQRGQQQQATAEQIANLERLIEQRATFQPNQLPAPYADVELNAELLRIHRRRGFFEASVAKELSILTKRIMDGDLALASPNLKAVALDRAARAHAEPTTVADARAFHADALRLNPRIDAALYDALILDADGNAEKALRVLRKLNTPEARAAAFNILSRNKGASAALKWIDDSGLQSRDFRPVGWLNVLIKRVEDAQYDRALTEVESLSFESLSDCPALHLIRGNLRLAAILPSDQRGLVFSGLPLNPKHIQFANDSASLTKLSAARKDFERLYTLADELRLSKLKPYLEEQILWLKLEEPATRDEARAAIAEEIKDQGKTLWRVRLALTYNVPFNKAALQRHLLAQKQVGDWTDDERFAVFLLALYDDSPPTLAEFFDQYGNEIFAKPQLDLASLAGIEAEALSRVGRFVDARKRIEFHRKAGHVDEAMAKHLLDNLQSVEDGSEAERFRKLYEAEGQLNYLRSLVSLLYAKKDQRQLAIYAPLLARETKRVEDFGLALQVLYADHKYAELVALCDQLPQIYQMQDDFASLKGWSCFSLGRLMEARAISRKLREVRNSSSDRELAINTSVETGDWGYLATILSQETKRIDELESKDLVRLARLALETGSTYVDTFRDAAIRKSPDAAEPYLMAYQLSLDRGDEYQESRAHEWFQKAVELSGKDGPVQSMPLKEIVRRSSGWNKKVDTVNEELRQARVPLYLAARALNRQPIEAFLGLALRNSRETEAKLKYPVLAFSGARPRMDLSGVRALALDVTALFTLDFLGLLQKTIGAFDEIVIAPSTLSSLFFDKQFIRFRQPSQVAKAKRIKDLISRGRLKLLKREATTSASSLDIDPDLQMLLDLARAAGAKVVRSAPVHKLHSFLEETVNLDAYNDVLVDTRAVLNLLSTKVDSSTERKAATYLNQVDKGWANNVAIDSNSIIYLDELSVTYLDHVGLLERLADNVAEVHVSGDVESDCSAVLQSADMSADLGAAVDRIRTALNAAIEKGSNIKFSSRRLANAANRKEEGDEGSRSAAFPSFDILSDLTGIDAIVCDDRFLNKEPFWTDGERRVLCGTTVDVIMALNSRAVISEQQRFDYLYRLRVAGFCAVPIEPNDVINELLRARINNGVLEETPELTEIRQNLTISLRSRMFLDAETPWLDQSRLAVFQALRAIWSGRSAAPERIARANWLLALLPDPMAWCVDPTNEEKWGVAAQKSAAQIGMLVASAFLAKDRQQQYGAWIEEELVTPTRANAPWLWEKAFQVYVVYLKHLMEADQAPPELQKAIRLHVLRTLSEMMRKELVSDDRVSKEIGLEVRTIVTVNSTHSIFLSSYNNCLRAALRGRKSFSLLLENGEKKKVGLSLKSPGVVAVTLDDLQFDVLDAALLSKDSKERAATLQRLLIARPLTVAEEACWRSIVSSRDLTDEEYGDLGHDLRTTPETLIEVLARPQTLSPHSMVPDELAYFERLVGPLVTAADFSAYVDGPLKVHRTDILRKGQAGVRRLAYSALSHTLVPFEALRKRPLKEFEGLLDASDPFSLLFGFEVCMARVAQGATGAAQAGKRFLEKIFGDEAWLQQRCELFAACAVISMVQLRSALKDRPVPLYWFRLAALTHAGVLANALSGMSKTSEFLTWSIKELGASYTWNSAVDTHDAPRWESDWIDPQYLKNEFIGRCYNAINLLPKSKRPKGCSKIIEAETSRLKTMMFAFYAGPMDDFIPQTVTDRQVEVYKRLKSIVRRKKSFKDARGLETIAHTGAVGKPLSNDVLKLLERSDEELTSSKDAAAFLRCCAYIAATNRNEKLAEAVTIRCLRLVTPQSSAEEILRLILIAMMACAAYQEKAGYHKALSDTLANFAYRTPQSAVEPVRLTLELLHRRDLRLMATLGRAMAILKLATVRAA